MNSPVAPTEIERLIETLRNTCAGVGTVATADIELHDEAADMLASLAASLEQRTKALEEIYAGIVANRDTPKIPASDRSCFSDDICLVLNIARRVAGIELDTALSGSDR